MAAWEPWEGFLKNQTGLWEITVAQRLRFMREIFEGCPLSDINRRSWTGSNSRKKEVHMKVLSSAIVLGIGFLMVSGSPARAQFGDLGEAAKKGASDAVKQEIMKGAGLQTPGAPAVTPAAATGAATTPVGELTPGAADTPAATAGADTGTPVDETTPEAADTPAATAGAGAATTPVGELTPGAADTPAAGLPGGAGTLGEELLKKKMPKIP